MLSADTRALPLKTVPRERIQQMLGRFLRRLVQSGRWDVPDLPEDLHRDLGLGEELPSGRADAFWRDRRRSAFRDLPL